MDFLKYIDIAIGLALVMVLVSPVVTAVTQSWMWIRNRRSVFLKEMLGRILAQIGGMDAAVVTSVTDAVVRHPQLARTPAPWDPRWVPIPPMRNRDAEVVQREELIRVLLELAAADGPAATLLKDGDRDALKQALANNGVRDPADTLKKLREASQRIEHETPKEAAHVRNIIAILETAQSDFVGKITQWFDAAAARATQQYAAEARAVTVVAALLAAAALQLDSVDLLRRLSADPDLRASLVQQADTETKRVEEAKKRAAATDPDADPDVAEAKAKRDDIERNLALLRQPSFAVLPDHFAWEPLAVGRLDANPLWRAPYPTKLTLIVGNEAKAVPVQWRRDVLTDLKLAIDASKAPVKTALVSPGGDVLLRAKSPLDVQVTSGSRAIAIPFDGVAQAVLEKRADWPASVDFTTTPMRLLIDETPYPLPIAGGRDEVLTAIQRQLATAKVPVVSACHDTTGNGVACADASAVFLAVTAHEPAVNDLRLLWDPDDPVTNILNDPVRAHRAWRVPAAALREARSRITVTVKPFRGDVTGLEVSVPVVRSDGVSAAEVVTAFNAQAGSAKTLPNAPVATVFPGQQLVITAKKKGPLELRVAADRPDSDVLNRRRENVYPVFGVMGGGAGWTSFMGNASGFGLLLSWVLLSFGGPFWYDALKNLLKLRPSAAAAEERARIDRAHTGGTKK